VNELQAKPGAAGTLPFPEIERRLSREGIAIARNPNGQQRKFSITVCDLAATDVVRVWPQTAGKLDERRLEPDDRLRNIVSRTAARAVYVLGLQGGQVEIAVDDFGRPSVVSVSGTMRPSGAEAERRTHAANRLLANDRERESVFGIQATLGADPEFVLRNSAGELVSASRFLPPEGLAGCDSVVRRGVRIWPLVELRPEPAEEPDAVVRSLRRLLVAAARRIGGAKLTWLAGALPVRGLPLGGHVHFGGVMPTALRLRALDNAVALPLRLLEPASASGRRPRYGTLGDWRRQPHGFEYRTPPSWLLSPKLALGTLSLAKIAVTHARELSGHFPLDDEAMRDAYYSDNPAPQLREVALEFHELLKQTAGYRRYAAAIDFIFDAVREGRRWNETKDFRHRWGIPAD